jgi:diaminopimelate epimerase
VNEIRFAKYSGSGNDFIMIDNRDGAFPAGRELIARMCARRFAVGANGLILVEPSMKAAVRMRYYNGDGGEAEMCGNGARCFVAFASELGIPVVPLVFETMERVLSGRQDGENVTVEMGEVRDTRLDFSLSVEGAAHEAHFTNTGVPHVVLFVTDLEGIDVAAHGRAIRFHEEFQPSGANVNFVGVREDGGIEVRTYERGVEGETLACGTGVVAAAVVAHLVAKLEPPVKVRVRSGDVLTVGFRREGETFSKVTLSGPAVHVYDGVYRVGELVGEVS